MKPVFETVKFVSAHDIIPPEWVENGFWDHFDGNNPFVFGKQNKHSLITVGDLTHWVPVWLDEEDFPGIEKWLEEVREALDENDLVDLET